MPAPCDHYKSLFSGVLTCLAESADTLVQNLEEVRPTHMSSVPRFYEKVLAACTAADPEKTARNLRRVFGDRVDWLSSGGAPLPAGRRPGLSAMPACWSCKATG